MIFDLSALHSVYYGVMCYCMRMPNLPYNYNGAQNAPALQSIICSTRAQTTQDGNNTTTMPRHYT